MHIQAFQKIIADTYLKKDKERGLPATFMWFMEEVGELSTSLREGTKEEQEGEFADVYAWLMTLANLQGIDMEKALQKFSTGCSGCGQIPCACIGEKP
jgi:NTP pyrophosphatase (non-canonical NTP hydrolase)